MTYTSQMPRAQRYEVANGWYHVINRGTARRHIFVRNLHKIMFLACLEETVEKYNFNIHCFCIMGNHYHLLINTPQPNLSDGMRFLNSRYARDYNALTRKDGPIFRSRFKSIYVANESYLTNVSRYIHLNPVQAGIVDDPKDYPWSSYRDYIRKEKTFPWLNLDLNSLGHRSYSDFIKKGNSRYMTDFYSKLHPQNILK